MPPRSWTPSENLACLPLPSNSGEIGEHGPYRLEGMELASGLVLGYDRSAPPLPPAADSRSPRQVLEDVLEASLRHPPCVVQFSGGRDSSAVLALASLVARRAGLPLPIPVTMVFPGMAEAGEDEWQEMVVRHLQLSHWERLPMSDEMDLVGPIAAPLLLEHGPTYPSNGHFIQPAIQVARGGTMLTGVGGDELFDVGPLGGLSLALTRRRALHRRDLRTLALVAAPGPLRAGWYRRQDLELDWLRPRAQQQIGRMVADWRAASPLWWADDVRAWWTAHPRRAIAQTLRAFGHAEGVNVTHPLQEAAFLSALAARYKRAAWVNRSAAMDDLFGDVLPRQVTHRSTKALFSEVFFGPHAREFAERWNGEGVDVSLVDPDRLNKVWLGPEFDARAGSVLQGAWTALNRGDSAPAAKT
jgi:asparagine synthetase B (glutamine-hydrolysing)